MDKNELTKIEIDLDQVSRGELSESYLRLLGMGIKYIMNAMFGGTSMPVTVRGKPQQVRDFARVLGREKRYLTAYSKYGLNDPKTYRSRYKLDSAVRKFERSTGITWPFK
tara:strand:+ start:1206 stop:1535 length:330 start_codon:yes stop_codon:yes gene_type:complete